MHNSDFQKLDHPVRTFFRFLKFLLPYWDKVLFIILGIMIAAPMGNIHMVISKAIIDQVVLNQNESIKRRLFMLFFFMSLAAVITWSGQLLERLRGFMGFYLRMFVTLDLRRKFYSHLHRLPFKFFQGRPIGEHMYRCMNDISSEVWTSRGIVDMITANAPDIFRILNDMFWQGMIVFFLNPMAAFFIGVTIIPYTILSYWMNTWIKRAFFRLKREEQAVPAVLRDTIAGVETVKSYGRRRYMNNRYVRQLISSIRATMRRDYLQVALDQFVFWALDLIAVGGLWTYLARQLMIGEITVGSFYVLLNISVRFIGPFKQMINQYMTIRQQLVPTQRVLETLDVEPEIQDLPNAMPLPRINGGIRFQNVSFAYDPEVPVLRNVSFDVKPGETLGIVGRSGAGKTTILNLLLRMHRPSSGSVLIDDYDLDKIRISDWQKRVGIVLQNTYIFGGDIAYNIRYGNLDASPDQIRDSLKMADAEQFVAEMPEGVHTELAEGAKLSGGQRQRLGIARALVRRPGVLLLDEPTSSLDSRTENEIWRSFEKAMQETTAIIVSHRLFTVRKADHIIVLEKGEVVERGSHDELLRLGGIYAAMWRDQTGGAA